MDSIDRGEAIKRRRIALGYKSHESFLKVARRFDATLSRDTLRAVENGEAKVQETTWLRVESVLDRLDEEMSGPNDPTAEPKEGLVEFRLSGNFGVDVVVRGPVSDLAELEAAVGRLLSQMGDTHPNG